MGVINLDNGARVDANGAYMKHAPSGSEICSLLSYIIISTMYSRIMQVWYSGEWFFYWFLAYFLLRNTFLYGVLCAVIFHIRSLESLYHYHCISLITVTKLNRLSIGVSSLYIIKSPSLWYIYYIYISPLNGNHMKVKINKYTSKSELEYFCWTCFSRQKYWTSCLFSLIVTLLLNMWLCCVVMVHMYLPSISASSIWYAHNS